MGQKEAAPVWVPHDDARSEEDDELLFNDDSVLTHDTKFAPVLSHLKIKIQIRRLSEKLQFPKCVVLSKRRTTPRARATVAGRTGWEEAKVTATVIERDS